MAIIAWVHSQAKIAVDNISQRAITSLKIQGHSDRIRGSYRKAFPGQKTSVYKDGFSEKIDAGWDKQAADWSRDKLDSDRRTWTQITNRRVSLTGSGVAYQGPVNRPNAPNLQPTTLPDGAQEFVAYLQPGATLASRYISGQQDVIPFAENTQFTQEYSLDYIPPMEAIQTTLLDTLLGIAANPWNRTTVTTATGGVSYDNETYMSQQMSDHPTDPSPQAPKVVGPTTGEAPLRYASDLSWKSQKAPWWGTIGLTPVHMERSSNRYCLLHRQGRARDRGRGYGLARQFVRPLRS